MAFANFKEAKQGEVQATASYHLQRFWRGYWARAHLVPLREAALSREDFKVVYSWAVVTCQRYVRGHQAKAQVAIKKVELGLSDRLQRLAHTYLQNGDLWGFLRAVDGDYTRYVMKKKPTPPTMHRINANWWQSRDSV